MIEVVVLVVVVIVVKAKVITRKAREKRVEKKKEGRKGKKLCLFHRLFFLFLFTFFSSSLVSLSFIFNDSFVLSATFSHRGEFLSIPSNQAEPGRTDQPIDRFHSSRRRVDRGREKEEEEEEEKRPDGRFVGWSNGWLGEWMDGWLVGWLVDCLIGWLIG